MQHPHQCFKVISSFNYSLLSGGLPTPLPSLSRPETSCAVYRVSGELCHFDVSWKGHVAGLVCTLNVFGSRVTSKPQQERILGTVLQLADCTQKQWRLSKDRQKHLFQSARAAHE